MIIKITGASGYLGKLISFHLIQNGHEVTGIKRDLLYNELVLLKEELKKADVVINLSGAPILKFWNKKNRRIILESRIITTQNLVKAMNDLPEEERPKKFISASAIGIYKSGLTHDESSTNFDEGFVGTVAKNWESATNGLSSTIQKNIFRIGLVLGKNAKTIKNLALPFQLGLGATIGNGKQPFPFIHEKDLIRAFVWAVEDLNKNGMFNLVAPEKISNKDFTKALANALNRPTIFAIPGFILKMVLGEASVLLTESPEVDPTNLLNAGFRFEFPTIENALGEIF